MKTEKSRSCVSVCARTHRFKDLFSFVISSGKQYNCDLWIFCKEELFCTTFSDTTLYLKTMCFPR